jgi:hypothetical protein
MSSVFPPSRRVVLAGLATLPVLGPGAAEASIEDRARALAQALRDMELPHAPSRLDLVRYGDGQRDGVAIIQAVVRLTWSPGVRSRKIEVHAPDYGAGLEDMLVRAYETFADPH